MKKYTSVLFLLLFFHVFSFGEGTKEIMSAPEDYAKLRMDKSSSYNDFALYSATEDERLYIRIGNLGEKIHFGFGSWGGNTLYCRIKDPAGNIVWGETSMTYAAGTKGYISSYAQAIAGPDVLDPAGYMPFTYVPQTTGDFYIEFNYSNGSRELDYFDITIIDTTNTPFSAIKGRVFSKAWQFSSGSITSSPGFKATMFVCADDSVVTSLFFNGMQGHAFEVSCNQNGCFPPPTSFQTSRMSNGAHVGYPQYKIFLNDPDILQFPSGVPGNIIPESVMIEAFCNGTFTITFNVTKAGSAEVFLNINPLPGVQAEDVILSNTVNIGSNSFTWDGNNGFGDPVPNGALVEVSVSYINGLTNFPVWDVESHPNGFVVELIRPTGSSPTLFWDDSGTGVWGGQNLIGCISAIGSGCHTWIGDYYSGIGNENTINSWWYAASTSTVPVTLPFKRFPPNLGSISGETTVCRGAGSVIYSVNPEPNTTEYFWTWPAGWTAISSPPFSNSIELNVTGTAVSGNVTVHGENTECGAGPISSLAVTILPIPELSNSPMSKTICSGDNVNITLTSATPGTTYTWTVTSTPNITGYPASGSGASISHVLTNSNSTPGTVWYAITPSANGCNGAVATYTVTVSPKPSITTAPLSKNICSEEYTNITLTSNIAAGTTYAWTVSPNSLGATAGSSATGVINQQLTNPGGTTLTVTYTITPENNGCFGNSVNYVVTVYPKPLVTNSLAKTICSATSTNISLTSNVATASFTWNVIDNPDVTGEANGSGSTINQTLTNNTFVPQTVTYTITASANSCTGPSVNYIVTVNPTPDVSNTTLASSICSGGTTSINLTTNVAGTTFSWTASGVPGTSGFSNGSGSSITQTLTNTNTTSATVQYTVTPAANSCTGSPKTFTVTIYPTPHVTNAPPSSSICSMGTTNIVLLSDVSGATFTWTVTDNPDVDGESAGSGATISQTLESFSYTPEPVVYHVTPTANGCTGITSNYTVTVNPIPDLTTSPMTATICSGNGINVPLTSNVSGTTFSWTASASSPLVTGFSNGSGTNINQTPLVNNSTSTQTITYQITPLANGCNGLVYSYVVTIHPIPVASSSPSTQTICSGTSAAAINLNSTVSGTTFTWTTVGSPGVSGFTPGGSGSTIPAQAIATTQTSQGTVTHTITPSYNGCAGTPINHIIYVNPVPLMTVAPLNKSICSGSSTNIPLTADVTGTTFAWTVAPNPNISGEMDGSGNIINQTLTNLSFDIEFVTYHITPTAAGCQGLSVDYEVIVFPHPTITNTVLTSSICHGFSTSINLTTEVSGTTFTWTASGAPGTSGFSNGSGSSIAQQLFNSNLTPATVQYVVTPSANGCTGTSKTFTVTVNPLPVPTIAGPTARCLNTSGVYTTQPGMTNYTWVVPPGAGNITSGAGTNTITVNWIAAGNHTISVNFNDPNGCTAVSPTTYNITVNPLPNPTVSGPGAVCLNQSNTYSTQLGMSNYTWTLSPDGTILSGGGTASVNISWGTVGAKTVSINYNDPNGCTAASATSYPVTVNVLPVPTLTGQTQVCIDNTETYITESGMQSYQWTVSPGGTVIAGGDAGSSTVTVTWTTTGARSVSVNYSLGTGCAGAAPTVLNVTVNPRPSPTIAGPTARCLNTSGVYTTQPGMSNYTWIVPPGTGNITAGAGTNTITVNWIATGLHTISVNYENAFGCAASLPTTYSITVNPLPNPTVTGPGAVCMNQSSTYSTELGMSNYTWSVTPDGTILSGGGTASVNISWSAIGAKTVSINYNDPNGCTAPASTPYTVNVNVLPVPTLSGLDQVCVDNTEIYTTESGMQNYQWTVSPGGTVIAGGNGVSSTVTVTWTAVGARSVSVNYSLGTGCAGAAPTVRNVMVNPRPLPTINGDNIVCEFVAGVTYEVTPATAGNNYQWSIAGGTIISGQGTSTLTVTWGSYGTGLLDVNETITATGCDAPAPTFSVTLDPYPLMPGAISGVDEICRAQSGLLFSVPPVTYATSTIWNYTGTGINFTQIDPLTVSIDFGLTATSGLLQVRGNNACGNGPVMEKQIDVRPLPVISFALCQDTCSINTKPFILKGAYPYGGTYSGQGVLPGNAFDPTSLLPGNYHIRYTIANAFTCVDSAYALMTVIPATPAITCGELLTDARDGKQYPTVMIGSRCWMARNLNYGIRILDDLAQKDNCSHEKYCYGNNSANCSTMGGLYQWHEAMQFSSAEGAQGICPAGWHVATEDDWNDLFTQFYGPSQSGNPMKTTGFSGFNATFSGGTFQNLISDFSNEAVFYWSSTQHGKDHAWAHSLNVETPSVALKPAIKANAFYVRCVRD